MQDAWRSYLELALGLSEASRKKAANIVNTLTDKGGATVEQLQAMAQDLAETSTANREALVKLIQYELDRALGAVGLATMDEVSELSGRIRHLEDKLRDADRRAAAAEVAAEAGRARAGAKPQAGMSAAKSASKGRTAQKTAAGTRSAGKKTAGGTRSATRKAQPQGTGTRAQKAQAASIRKAARKTATSGARKTATKRAVKAVKKAQPGATGE